MSSGSNSDDSGDDADIMDSISGATMRQLLKDAGVEDTQSLDTVLVPGGRKRAQGFKLDESELDNDKYFVDVDDDDLPEEKISPEEAARRQRQRQMEDRYARLAMQTVKDDQKRKVKVVAAAPAVQLSKEEIQEAKRRKIMAEHFPNFKKGDRVKFSDVLFAPARRPKAKADKIAKPPVKTLDVPLPLPGPDPITTFASTSALPVLPTYVSNDVMSSQLARHFDAKQIRRIQRRRAGAPKHEVQVQVDWVRDMATDRKGKGKDEGPQVMMVDLVDWEKDIVFDSRNPSSLAAKKTTTGDDLGQPRNQSLLDGSWVDDIVWDTLAKQRDLEEVEDIVKMPIIASTNDAESFKSPALDPYNLSNDHLYQAAHGGAQQFRIRQTFGNIEVVHAGPAKSLQLPFYKTSLSKQEARSWRRPALQFPVGVSITFSKLKSNKDTGRSKSSVRTAADMAERLKTTKDLTLSEKGAFVLFEFSEEYPPIMSGFGMGTTIVNYYRKKGDKDEFVPKLELGEPAILEPGDAEPYLLGYVDPGKVTQSLYNNLIRAPIFKHTPEPTDFLVIRQTINSQPNYYVREIKNLFTVGQTYPNESEVPGPHARKNTNVTKHRLMIVAWSLIQRTKGQRIKLGKLMRYFPDQTELQMRQRFKTKGNEFMTYLRHGPDQGYWKLNPEFVGLPVGRANVQALVTPEAAMLYEAMQVGARHLHDAGYSKTADGGVEDDVGEGGPRGEGLDIEQQLAVWTITTNYKQAESGKAWLVLHGEGDPTARGEGYSFLKTSMKGFFLRRGETEAERKSLLEDAKKNPLKISNAEQARIYEEEKRKIWDAQAASLGGLRPPELDEDDEEAERAAQRQRSSSTRRGFSRASSAHGPGAWQHESPRDRSPSAMSRGSSVDRDDVSAYSGRGEDPQGRILRIKRVVRGKVEYEIVRDDNIINAYLASLKVVREKAMLRSAESLRATGDPETDAMAKRVLQEEIEKVKRNQARRLARKGDKDEEGRGVQRKCGACGQVGHTRSNSKMCPLFGQSNIDASPSTSTPNAPAPLGFGSFSLGADMGRPEVESSGSGKLILKLGKNA